MNRPIDYYEVLQINPNADNETIHRVYRIMASRFHPDNPKTGDTDRFLVLREAYDVLTDPVRRAQYDRTRAASDDGPLPIFELQDFIDGLEGEVNRRLGVLAVLYHFRRVSGSKPGISVLELEKRMALPREYLDFTLWYLRSKGYVSAEDNSDYSVTAKGVDYLESVSFHNPLAKLLVSPPLNHTAEMESEENVSEAA